MSVLTVELPRQVVQETVGGFLTELPLRQRKKACLLFYYVVKQEVSTARLDGTPLWTIVGQGLEQPLGLVLIFQNIPGFLFTFDKLGKS